MISPEEFWRTLQESLACGSCLGINLGDPSADAVDDARKITIRPIVVKGRQVFQWASRRGDREGHENLAAEETGRKVRALLGPTYRRGHVFTAAADFDVKCGRDYRLTVHRSRPTRSAGPLLHDRVKHRFLAEGVPHPFLVATGVMTPQGKVRASKQAKFRQINRFLELVDDVADSFRAGGPLRVVDFGCGKSYLTFALYFLLTEIRGREVEIVGFDRKSDVVADCSRLSQKLGCRGLEFRAGQIAEQSFAEPIDLAIALHACDTATDDALTSAVAWKSTVIMAVPCCQHELARTIHVASMAPLHKHGVLHEQFASLATDALRAQALEACGYKAQVVEFISPEHTTKNLLIRAVRRQNGRRIDPAARAAYEALKETLGLGRIATDRIIAAANEV